MQVSIIFSLITLIIIKLNYTLSERIKETNEVGSRLADYSDGTDEGSCICGLNKEILDKIESIVIRAIKEDQVCSIQNEQSRGGDDDEKSELQVPVENIDHKTEESNQNQMIVPIEPVVTVHPENRDPVPETSQPAASGTTNTDPHVETSESLFDKLTAQIQALEAQLASSLKPHDTIHSQQSSDSSSSTSSVFTSMWKPHQPDQNLQQQHQQIFKPIVPSSTSTLAVQIPPTTSVQKETATTSAPSADISQQVSTPPPSPVVTTAIEQPLSEPSDDSTAINSFLQGISSSSMNSAQKHEVDGITLAGQSVPANIQTVQSTLESTVPNVVSNIFTNIQDLAIQTEQNPNANVQGAGQNSNTLTSIDGSSVLIGANETAAEITAQGEQLFLDWIDRQIQALHMTASMAAYIRRSALNLFRRIVKQYVERIGKLGGRVEDNVRRATQIALNNTQSLTSYILRNYLNFAGGLMQIIGEQVSRVGRQLDSTGETIAHINLNPFDIVSNVIGSLPNPSRYSEYFRAFGKYLMGETQQDSSSTTDQQQQGDKRKGGILSKTMGALGKTLGSWLG